MKAYLLNTANDLEVVAFTHLEAWIENLTIDNIAKKAVKQQVVARDKQIAELQEKLSRRNLQIDYLKKRIAKKQMLEAKARDDIKSCYAINKAGDEYLPNDKIDDHRFYMDTSHRLICEQNELLMALLVAEGKMASEDALNQ